MINHVSLTFFFLNYLVLHGKKKPKKKYPNTRVICNTRKTALSVTYYIVLRINEKRTRREREGRRGRERERADNRSRREILSAHLPSGASLTFLPHFNALHVPVTSQGILQDYCPRSLSTRKDIRAALRDCVSRTCIPDTPDREETFLLERFHSHREFFPSALETIMPKQRGQPVQRFFRVRSFPFRAPLAVEKRIKN